MEAAKNEPDEMEDEQFFNGYVYQRHGQEVGCSVVKFMEDFCESDFEGFAQIVVDGGSIEGTAAVVVEMGPYASGPKVNGMSICR